VLDDEYNIINFSKKKVKLKTKTKKKVGENKQTTLLKIDV
jgi:hypothetical protein